MFPILFIWLSRSRLDCARKWLTIVTSCLIKSFSGLWCLFFWFQAFPFRTVLSSRLPYKSPGSQWDWEKIWEKPRKEKLRKSMVCLPKWLFNTFRSYEEGFSDLEATKNRVNPRITKENIIYPIKIYRNPKISENRLNHIGFWATHIAVWNQLRPKVDRPSHWLTVRGFWGLGLALPSLLGDRVLFEHRG